MLYTARQYVRVWVLLSRRPHPSFDALFAAAVLGRCERSGGPLVQLPQYIISDFNTFVCTACSGIHREFSHRVKSISLATFSEEEVAAVKAGGNDASNKLYMARCLARACGFVGV